MNEILLRGCTLKNSGHVLGLVVYTGAETRIQQNAAETPLKYGAPPAPQPFQPFCACSNAYMTQTMHKRWRDSVLDVCIPKLTVQSLGRLHEA